MSSPQRPEFALTLRKTMEAEHAAMAANDSCPMKPARILADVRSVMGREDILGEDCYVDFTNPDFKMLAEAMHCKGYRVEKAEDLIPTLEEAFRQSVPSVIVVPVDYSENMKLSAHQKEVCRKGEGFLYIEQRKQKAPVRPKLMDAFLIVSIASKEVRVPRKKLVKRPNREKRAKKLKKGVAKRAGVWYYT